MEGQPLPALDESDPQGYAIGMVDGSVRSLPKSEELVLRCAITRAGGEVIMWPAPGGFPAPVQGATSATRTPTPTPALLPTRTTTTTTPAPAAMGSMMSGYHPAPPQALEQRLQRVEEKLDRVLEKLDQALSGSRSPRP